MKTKRPCPNPKCGAKELDVVRTYVARSPGGDVTVHWGNCAGCGKWRDAQELPTQETNQAA